MHWAIKSVSKMVLSILSCKNVYKLLSQNQRNLPKMGVKWVGIRVNNWAIKVLQPGLAVPSATLERRPGKKKVSHPPTHAGAHTFLFQFHTLLPEGVCTYTYENNAKEQYMP